MRDPEPKSGQAPELAAIAAAEGLPIHVLAMDVDSDASVASGYAAIVAAAGHVDVLVNNAGIARDGVTEELSLDDFRAVMETNYFGAIRCMKAVVKSMRERRSGCVINVTSIAGQISTSPLGAYAASKFALEAVTEAFAQEMRMFGVRVAIVQPGTIDTPMANGFVRDVEEGVYPYPYPQRRRFADYFAASLKTPRPPELVADKILSIAESESWQLRYPVGPDAAAILEGRRATPDEEYVALHGADDATWYAGMGIQRPGLRD
jgi:NAD(P)-dependent dehydrogenase (short-subunit alcohol dehydrogenase family)